MDGRVATRALALGSVAAAAGLLPGSASARQPTTVGWSTERAERQAQQHPPRRWVARGWNVVHVDCDGLGTGLARGGRRLYRDFSCEISVVKPLSDCPSSGIYFCVAGYEASALERTLHVLGWTRYALYRPR